MSHEPGTNAVSRASSSPSGSPFGQRVSRSSRFSLQEPSPLSDGGQETNFKNVERKFSRSPRFSRQEPADSSSGGGQEDFRAMARRISKSGTSTQMLDPSARLAAQKKIEAEEKLKMQQEIEDMKNKMNSVETVEKTGFNYDPSKVKLQIETEMKEAEEALDDLTPLDPESQEYKEFLEEIMSQGWNDEVKELVSGRKKVTKRNLIRARKRSIVRRYSIIVPDVKDDYNLPVEEDEFTEQEKLRQEVESRFKDEVDLNYTIEELSNNMQWMAEIQELVVAKKKINHQNLKNARMRNIVLSSQSKYLGCTYDLELEPDELTDAEIERQKLDKDIASIRVVLDEDDEAAVTIDRITKTWSFDIDQLVNDKKKKNKKNIFNYLVRQLMKEAKDRVPELEYTIDLEEDEYIEEEQKRRQFEIQLESIDLKCSEESVESLSKMYSDLIDQLSAENRIISKDNILKQIKLDALNLIYGEDDDYMRRHHDLTEFSFELTPKGLADKFINDKMQAVEDNLNDTDNFQSHFADEMARLKSVKAQTHRDNLRKLCLNMATIEAAKIYPDSGIEVPSPGFELTAEGKDFIKLSSELTVADSLLKSTTDDQFLTEDTWEKERQYLQSKQTKVSPKNIINVKKQTLFEEFKNNYPTTDYDEKFEFEEYTAKEVEEIQAKNQAARYSGICDQLDKDIEDAKISIDRAYKRSQIECDCIENHLPDFDWKDEVAHLQMIEKKIDRKSLFEIKCKNLVEKYRRENKESNFGEYNEIKHEYESEEEEEEEEEEEDDYPRGCLSCEIKSQPEFFDDVSDEQKPEKIDEVDETTEDHVLEENLSNQSTEFPDKSNNRIVSEPFNSDTTATPSENVTEGSIEDTRIDDKDKTPDGSLKDVDPPKAIDSNDFTDPKCPELPDKSTERDVSEPSNSDITATPPENVTIEDTIIHDKDKTPHESPKDVDPPKATEPKRPEVLLSQGFEYDSNGHVDSLESCTLPSALLASTPHDPMSSPFPNHGYINHEKTFGSRDDDSANPQLNSVEDSAYESRSSYKSEEPENSVLGLAFPQSASIVSNGTEEHQPEFSELLLPNNLKSDSIGSDNVFDIQSANPSPIPLHNELHAEASNDTSSEIVTPNVEEKGGISGNDGDTEFSPADDGELSRRTSTDPPRPLTLPGQTITQMRKVSSESEDGDNNKPPRSPKRKKLSGSGSGTFEQHPLIKRQEDYNRRSSILEAKRMGLMSSHSKNSVISDDTPTSCIGTPTRLAVSPRPETLELKSPKKVPAFKRTNTEGSLPNFDHIKSNYKMEKPNPLLDRKKYIKVPTLQDKLVTSRPILEGLLPKEFYQHKLSFDVSDYMPKSPLPESRKNRSQSEIAFPTTVAPTTGHLMRHLMRERKLEREEMENIITDLDLAIVDKEHFTVVSSQILGGRENGQPVLGRNQYVRAIVSRCTCKTPFQLDRVGDGKYKLPNTSQIFFVRILRNHVMVRVGGGWDTLDHFIAKHDPCRMKFKQISGGENFSPSSQSPTSAKSSATASPSPRRSVPRSPMGTRAPIQKSASGHSLRSPSPRSMAKQSQQSPVATPRSKTKQRPTEGNTKLPRPAGKSKLVQPKSRLG